MKKGNLLIVDDEPILVEFLKATLEEFAEKIFTGSNGLEALKALDQETIHCIICDINMPKMNGVELIQKIREKKIEIPFIFYTGHGNHKLMMEAVKFGAFDFLDKPSLDGLEDVVQRGLNKGLNLNQEESVDTQSFVSEYQKMLKDIL